MTRILGRLLRFALSESSVNTFAHALCHHAPVAQLVEHWAAMREVVSSTMAGPTLRVLK